MAQATGFAQAAAYDLLHPPGERLARDGAHLAAWAGDAVRVLELACGTGAVAAFLATGDAQRTVAACDLSPAMVARARGAHPQARVAWMVGDMRLPPSGPFERILILGNSLNLLPDRAAVAATLAALRGVCAPEGRLLLQLINPASPRYREPRLVQRSGTVDGRPLLAVKSLVPAADGHLLTLSWRQDGEAGAEALPLLDLGAEALTGLLAAAGWRTWSLHGGLDLGVYDPAASSDLVVQAW